MLTSNSKPWVGQRRLQISRVKNISTVFELSGVAFCLVLPYGGLLVKKYDKGRSEVDGNIISGVVVEKVGVDVLEKIW